MSLTCQKCKSNTVTIILFLMCIVVLLLMLFGCFISKYVELKKYCWDLEKDLKQVQYELSVSEAHVEHQNKTIEECNIEKIELSEEIFRLRAKLEQFTNDPVSWIRENYKSYNLEITAYSPSVDECDSDPFIAASGKYVDDWTIAVSPNMRKEGWDFGDFVYIPDHYKFYKINDVMNSRYTKRVDVFLWTKQEANDFGFCDVDVYLID